MKILILLHTTTGNTRVVTRYVAARLRNAGHSCRVLDIVKQGDQPPDLSDVDLLGVACPTTYFRPTFAMDRFVGRLATLEGERPAFLLGTCAGEPGAHFAILAETLATKGWRARAAHWVMAPSNWPPHLHIVRRLGGASGIGRWLSRINRPLRLLAVLFWPEVGVADRRDRHDLDRFVDGVIRRSESGWTGPPPRPDELHRPLPTFDTQGRMIKQTTVDGKLGLRIDAARCDRCGTCVAVCPTGALTRTSDEAVPRFRRGCTGCYACFNRCPERAISAYGAPHGSGRYAGPPPAMRDLFRPPPRN